MPSKSHEDDPLSPPEGEATRGEHPLDPPHLSLFENYPLRHYRYAGMPRMVLSDCPITGCRFDRDLVGNNRFPPGSLEPPSGRKPTDAITLDDPDLHRQGTIAAGITVPFPRIASGTRACAGGAPVRDAGKTTNRTFYISQPVIFLNTVPVAAHGNEGARERPGPACSSGCHTTFYRYPQEMDHEPQDYSDWNLRGYPDCIAVQRRLFIPAGWRHHGSVRQHDTGSDDPENNRQGDGRTERCPDFRCRGWLPRPIRGQIL